MKPVDQRVHILGASGRLGGEVARLAAEAGLALTDSPERADAWALALPRAPAAEALAAAGARTVVDLSGVLKLAGGRYGMLHPAASGRLLSGGAPVRGERYGNPGCIAGAVIRGVLDSGVAEAAPGTLHISAVASASAAARDQRGALRLGRRGLDHPHVAEIEAALGVEIASFAVVVAYGVARGVMVTVSGELSAATPATRDTPATGSQSGDLDVADALETDRVLHRLRVHGRRFTLVAALDNLTFPAANAVALLQAALGSP